MALKSLLTYIYNVTISSEKAFSFFKHTGEICELGEFSLERLHVSSQRFSE
jgi:hypothetical protein